MFTIRLPGLEPADWEEWTWPPDGSDGEVGSNPIAHVAAVSGVDQ